MPPPGGSSQQGGQNTSARYSVNSTDCEFLGEFDSSCVFWHFAAFTAQHRGTLLAVYGVYAVRRCRRSSPPPLGQRSVAGRSINSTHDTRRPRLSCGCRQSMERPSTNDQGLTVAASLLTFQQLKHSFFNLHFTDSIMTDFSELLKISLLDDTKNNSNSSTIH